MLTLSIIKADTGGYVGHSAVHPDMVAVAQDAVQRATGDLLVDAQVATCGDDLSLIMTHMHGCDAEVVHRFAWDVFLETTAVAKSLGLYGAGQDLLQEAFSGNLRGMGPGYAELEIRRAALGARALLPRRQDRAWRLEPAALPDVRRSLCDRWPGHRPEDACGLHVRSA